MPFVIVLLANPAGAYGFLVAMLAAFIYACHTRTFVSLFTAISAALLTGLAFAYTPPNAAGLALLVAGAALLQAELLLPTYGVALVTGVTASAAGSWLLLGATFTAHNPLPPAPRAMLALLGTVLLLAAVLRGFRLRTLARR